MQTHSHMADQAHDDLREVRQRQQMRRTAFILASVAAAFFIGVIVRRWWLGG